MPRNFVVLLNNPEGKAMVRNACREKGFLFSEFEELVQTEIENTGKSRRRGLYDSFDDILDRIHVEDA